MFSSQCEVTFHTHGPVTLWRRNTTASNAQPQVDGSILCALWRLHKTVPQNYLSCIFQDSRNKPALQPSFPVSFTPTSVRPMSPSITTTGSIRLTLHDNAITRPDTLNQSKSHVGVKMNYCLYKTRACAHWPLLWATALSHAVGTNILRRITAGIKSRSLEQWRDNLNTNAYVRLWSGIIPQTAP